MWLPLLMACLCAENGTRVPRLASATVPAAILVEPAVAPHAQTAAPASLDAVTCGQASVFYVLDRLGMPVPLEEVQKVLPEGPDAMNSFAELKRALTHFGYPNSAGYDLSPEQLMRVRGAVIVATLSRGKDGETIEHFVTAEPRGNQILMLDSVLHPQLLSPAEFTQGKKVRVLVPTPDRQLGDLRSSREWSFSALVLAVGGLAATLAAAWVFIKGVNVSWRRKTTGKTL